MGPRLTLEAKREIRFYEEQSEALAKFISILGSALSVIFSIGAIVDLQAALLMHPEVLYRLGWLGWLGVHERGAVMPGLNMQLIRDLEIPLPPPTVQRRFEAAMRSISSQKQSMAESLAWLDALFTSLQHRAFCGEL